MGMKITVGSKGFAECMRKIQPAVSVVKDKKETVETSIMLTVTKAQKIEAGYVGIAVAYDGKKQLFSMFLASELEMEEDKKDIYISGKRLCDISSAMDNGTDVPMTLEVGKYCLVKKGGSQVQLPLGEKPVVLFPSDDWYVQTSVDAKEFAELMNHGSKFYSPGTEGCTGDVCICFDLKANKLQMSSTDTYKLGFYSINAALKKGKKMAELEAEDAQTPPALHKEGDLLSIQIDGEQFKVLSKFLGEKNMEICVYDKYVYFKSGADIALFMSKDIEKPYPLGPSVAMAKAHSKTCTIQAAPKEILDALTIFDVSNQGEEPYVHISKDKSGALCFGSKGKVSKTLVPCQMKGEFEKIILNSKIMRQVVSNYDKEDSLVLFTGSSTESVIITDKEDSENFNILSQVSV